MTKRKRKKGQTNLQNTTQKQDKSLDSYFLLSFNTNIGRFVDIKNSCIFISSL